MTTTTAATLYGPKDLRLVEAELPPVAPGFVRVRFAAGGICGSDMHYFSHGRIGNFVATAPLILGHEVAGTVAEIGDGVTGVATGQRVAVNPSRWCGTCARCREGRQNLCENIYFMGSASKGIASGIGTHCAGVASNSVAKPPCMCGVFEAEPMK